MGGISLLRHQHHNPALQRGGKIMLNANIHENQVFFFKPGKPGSRGGYH